jgi:hypothetical protein
MKGELTMMILIAGPYRSAQMTTPVDHGERPRHDRNRAARLPRRASAVMGEWFALPLIELAGSQRIGDPIFNEIFHPISRQLVARCDAVLRIGGPSSGADEMVSLAQAHGKQVYFRIEDIPATGQQP